jgi:hypothetical protein
MIEIRACFTDQRKGDGIITGILKLRALCELPDAFKRHSKLFFGILLADFNEKGILSRI